MNRQQRRRSERLEGQLAKKNQLLPYLAAKGAESAQTVSKRDYVAYTFAMSIALEAIDRTPGIGAKRKAEIIKHIKAIEADMDVERNEGDSCDGPFTQALAKELGVSRMGLGGTIDELAK